MEQYKAHNFQYLLIDANVLQYAGNRNQSLANAVIQCLISETTHGYSLAVSEFTVFENLHGLWGKKAREAANSLQEYFRFTITSEILGLASVLRGLTVKQITLEYKKEHYIKHLDLAIYSPQNDLLIRRIAEKENL